MLRLGLKRAISLTVALPHTRTRTLALCARPPLSLSPRHSLQLAHPPTRSRGLAHSTHDIMTITDSSYKPHAPYAFVTKPGSAIDHLDKQDWDIVKGREGLPAYAVYRKDIEKSQNDDRVYRLIMLENGLEALVVSDPKTDKAAAAMDVKVGHLSDPEDLPGLAHFCEHLMFMGTEKYPAENDYTEFLTQHSGSSNAFTGMDQTNYYFDVAPQHLAPALDRFAQFFISPLFDSSCTEREANAVHSENSKNLQNDMWRFYQLDKSTSSRKHAFWRFGTGNRETLWDEPRAKGVDVRQRLIDWCEKHYSANTCKLAVVSKDTLDETVKLVVSQFASVPNRHITPPEFPGSPLTSSELGQTLFIKSIRDTRFLELTFPFPDESELYASKPGSFLSHLIGHEGKGSVLSLLKKRGWANGMSAGAGNGAAGFEFFKVSVDLTKEGLEHYEDVAASIFAYISLLRSTPPAEWAFLEVAQLSQLAFRFKEKSPPSSTASRLAMILSKPYPRDKVLSAPWICTEWYPKKVEEFLDLMTPEKCRIFVSAQEEIEGRKYELREEWYGTEYTVERMSDKILNSGKSASEYPELALPEPNALVPQNLEIKNKVEVPEPARRPLNLRNTPVSRVWHKKDDRWWIPRAGVFFLFRSPLIDSSALTAVQTRLFTELVRDSLQEYAYDAELAGLSYNFDQQADGILLSADGYNDKLPLLIEVIVKRMKEYKVDEKRFAIVADMIRRMYQNFRLEQPYQHVGFDAAHLTQAVSYTVDEKLKALDQITPANLQSHIAALFSRMHIESLVHGNVLRDEALALAKTVEDTFKPEALTVEELKSRQALIIPEGKWLARRPVDNPANANSAVEQFTYVGDIYDDVLRAKLSLFGTMVSEPLFDDLRAKQQLGYIVSSGARKSIAYMGLRVIVQSERDSAFVESRIDAFWDEYKTRLDEMSEEEFEKYKATVISRKLEDFKNLWQESSAMWINIHAGWYDFEQRFRDAELVKQLSKSDIISFYHTYFFDTPERRIRRLSVHLDSQRLTVEQCASLGPVLAEMQVQVDPEQLGHFATSRPTVEQAKAFAEQFLRAQGRGDEDVKKVVEEIERLGKPKDLEGYQVIEDREQWRQQQERAPHAHPVAEYSDLFPAKL
ncbi:A-factor-processing enzyme [Rhodotorula toruloides]|uniref:BY PROTMAP: gi/472587935/gb/EMS25431.1/ a-pheromone processing metallopeptidase ste23 [Rhodosporidium toruloides NP11] gi/647401563/emb/CDR47887.1/ RHTO0S15e03290g1_1 [Rhodosporidium toruloides] n=2 Tax=Rhodotorula toruloides TaxID=5286 RepID=A0A0K3CI19_RHOTO|nr:A-factor-processing enzyme [Rhodotorula toruloides]